MSLSLWKISIGKGPCIAYTIEGGLQAFSGFSCS